MTQTIRAEALEWALRRLPPAKADGPPIVVIPVPEVQLSTRAPAMSDTTHATEYKRLVFRREVYRDGAKRWYEWTLAVALE